MTLGEKIRTLREVRRLSLREFARRLDVTAAFLSDIELGRRYPSADVMARIAAGLNTTTDELKSYDSRPPLEEIRRLSAINPSYGIAFRMIVEKEFSPDELLDIAKRKRSPRKK